MTWVSEQLTYTPDTSNLSCMNSICQFSGLYGQSTAEPTAEYLFSELLETRSRSFDWVIEPHFHAQLFQLFYVATGQITFREATGQRELNAPVVLLIPPTALHGFAYSPDATGRILSLSGALIDGLFPNASPLASFVGAVQCLTEFEAPYSVEQVAALLANIDRELFANQPEKALMLHLGLQYLFVVLFRIRQQYEVIRSLPNTPPMEHFRRFQQRVRLVGTSQSVAQLAADLAITPGHLNRICQEVASKSASQLVQEHILNEARKYLTYTAYSVSEIPYLLHFEYPNYFARFFKKRTGLTPTEFRESRRAG